MLRRLLVVVVAALWLWLLAGMAPAAAQPSSQGALIISPSPLTVVSAWGCAPWDGLCARSLQLTLRATEPITAITALAEDLRRADNAALLPGAAIGVALAQSSVAPNQIVTMTLTLPLGGLPAGEYSGSLLLSHGGGVSDLPITLRVRDWWLPPLALLLGTLILGIWYKRYRDSARPRDDLIVQAGYLAEMRGADAALLEPFQSQLDTQIGEARNALRFGNQAEAQAAVGAAQTIWRRWSRNRGAWIELGARQAELTAALDAAPAVAPGRMRATLEEELRQIGRDMPLSDDPEALRARLIAVRDRLDAYRQLAARIDALLLALAPLDEAAAAPLRAGLSQRRAALGQLAAGDQAALDELRAGLDADQRAVEEALAKAPPPPDAGEVLGGGLEFEARGVGALPLPEIGALAGSPLSADPLADARHAGRRRWLFELASLAIAIVGLVPVGFTQLYVDKPTFGLNPWLDYPALAFWALGIEATREAVLGMIDRQPGGPQ